ncbi:MAG: quinone-dependent dihydroorotate dehydrogenase [Cyanobacteria bacterium J06627_8]
MDTDLYRAMIRPLIFSGLNLDPEWAHLRALSLLEWLGQPPQSAIAQTVHPRLQQSFCVNDPRLSQSLWGLQFPNPVGLAAGFDKDGVGVSVWPLLGFGFAEIGTVTRHAQPGNPKPRLFRLIPDQAVLNRMGFNNLGAAALSSRLKSVYAQQSISTPIGVNLGKSKITPIEEAASDYLESFRQLKSLADYFVVNVSSPNTPGLRSLQSVEQLKPILMALQDANDLQKPLLVKIAPDLEWEAIAAVTDLAKACNLAGIIATNTTIRRDGLKTKVIAATSNPVESEAGGISGQPLQQRSTDVIRFIYRHTNGTLPIIGVGGIFTANDAWEKITAGACLIQTYTGWVYEGPWMIRRILQGLQTKLNENGLRQIDEAIGCRSSSENSRFSATND